MAIEPVNIEFLTSSKFEDVRTNIVSSLKSSGGTIKIETNTDIVAGFGSALKSRLLGAMIAGIKSFPREVSISLQKKDKFTHVKITVNDTFGFGSRIGLANKIQKMMYEDALNLKLIFKESSIRQDDLHIDQRLW